MNSEKKPLFRAKNPVTVQFLHKAVDDKCAKKDLVSVFTHSLVVKSAVNFALYEKWRVRVPSAKKVSPTEKFALFTENSANFSERKNINEKKIINTVLIYSFSGGKKMASMNNAKKVSPFQWEKRRKNKKLFCAGKTHFSGV